MMHKIIELGLLAMLASLLVALVGLIVGAFLNSMAIAIFFTYGVIAFGFAFLVCLAAMFIEGVR
jgi:hypothetical protein